MTEERKRVKNQVIRTGADGSSNGRTRDFGSRYLGSNPSPSAKDRQGLAGILASLFSLKIVDCARNCARLQSLIPRVAPSERVVKHTAGKGFIDFYRKSILFACSLMI